VGKSKLVYVLVAIGLLASAINLVTGLIAMAEGNWPKGQALVTVAMIGGGAAGVAWALQPLSRGR
jgi:NADH dehydrogenase FAD-containing subunit